MRSPQTLSNPGAIPREDFGSQPQRVRKPVIEVPDTDADRDADSEMMIVPQRVLPDSPSSSDDGESIDGPSVDGPSVGRGGESRLRELSAENNSGPTLELQQAVAPTETSVELIVDAPSNPSVGREFVFELMLRNTGSVPLSDVVVVAQLDPGLALPGRGDRQVQLLVGDFAVGAFRPIRLTAIARSPGRPGCRFEVSSGTQTLLTKQMYVDVATAGLDMKIIGPQRRTLGSRSEFLVRLTNRGLQPIRDIDLAVSQSAALELVAATEMAVEDQGALNWKLDALAAGESVTYQMEYVCQRISEACHVTAVASASRFGRVRHNRTLQIAPVTGNLDLQVGDSPDPIAIGQQCVFQASAANLGLQPLRQVQVRLQVPKECRIVAITVRGARDKPIKLAYRLRGREMVFDAVPVLEPGSRVQFEVRVTAGRPGDVTFRATAQHELSNVPANALESTTFLP